MIVYPYEAHAAGGGAMRLTLPDFDKVSIVGEADDLALKRLALSLSWTIEQSMRDRGQIRRPSRGARGIALPMELSLRLSLYWEMMEHGCDAAGLAARLGVPTELIAPMISETARVE